MTTKVSLPKGHKNANLNLIITTLNGYIIGRTKLTELTNDTTVDNVLDTLFTEQFYIPKLDYFNYADDLMGDSYNLELFLEHGTNKACQDTEYHKFKDNYLIEYVNTELTGYFDNFYVGLEIETK